MFAKCVSPPHFPRSGSPPSKMFPPPRRIPPYLQQAAALAFCLLCFLLLPSSTESPSSSSSPQKLAAYRHPAAAPWMPRVFVSQAAQREPVPPAALDAQLPQPRTSRCTPPSDVLPASCPRHLAGRPRIYTEAAREHRPIPLPPLAAAGSRDITMRYGSHIRIPNDSPWVDFFAGIREWEPNTVCSCSRKS